MGVYQIGFSQYISKKKKRPVVQMFLKEIFTGEKGTIEVTKCVEGIKGYRKKNKDANHDCTLFSVFDGLFTESSVHHW